MTSVSTPSLSSLSEQLEHCEDRSCSVSGPSCWDCSAGSWCSVLSNRLVHPWQSHPGQQWFPFLHPHCLVLQPFLQDQPFVRNPIVSCTCFCNSGLSQSNSQPPSSSCFHLLCSGAFSWAKISDSGECLHISDTQHERSQWRPFDVCEDIHSSSFDILSLTVLLISEYQPHVVPLLTLLDLLSGIVGLVFQPHAMTQKKTDAS